MPPEKLLIPTDSNELELVRTIKTKTEIIYEYRFIKSETKKGILMTISEENLNKNLKSKIFICDPKGIRDHVENYIEGLHRVYKQKVA